MAEAIKAFDTSIAQEEVDRLFRKLRDTRLPKDAIVPDAGWDYGELNELRSATPAYLPTYFHNLHVFFHYCQWYLCANARHVICAKSIGPSLDWITKLYNYWTYEYKWAEAQRAISQWQHYTTEIEGLQVHFIHEKARVRQERAIPLLLVHGWPGTFYE